MYDTDEHIENLTRHIELVRAACTLMGKRLVRQGRVSFGRLLIARGYVHDASKFHGIEWEYLHRGPDTPKEELELAIKQHTSTNSHHPEYHGGIENMPELDVAEMVADWYARGQEFGTDLRRWITDQAMPRFGLLPNDRVHILVFNFVDILLENSFNREVKSQKAVF